MTEILTESFCERCGSRYTFESSAPRRSRVGRIKMLSKGVRNFVLTDDSSFSEAMAEARSEEERAATAHQLDAFHKTFNFCLDCRQYTCGSCWNTAEGRCLSCAPDAALEAAAALIAEAPAVPIVPATETTGAIEDGSIAADAWPEEDVPLERLARAVGTPPAAGAQSPETAPEVDAALEADTTASAHAAAGDGLPAPSSVKGLEPGQSLEEAIAAWEVRQIAEDAPVDATQEPAPVATTAAEAEAEVAPEAADEGAAEVTAEADDIVPQPTWPTPAITERPETSTPSAPVAPGAPAPWLTVAPDNGPHEPQWPITPVWPQPGPQRQAPTTLAGRPLLPQGDVAAVWAASAREVLSAAPASLPAAPAAPSAQPCVACGLSLSANARFCRRCGARQT